MEWRKREANRREGIKGKGREMKDKMRRTRRVEEGEWREERERGSSRGEDPKLNLSWRPSVRL